VFNHGSKYPRDDKSGKKGQDGPAGYFYRAKSPAASNALNKVADASDAAKKDGGEKKPTRNKMANLLSCLKAEDGQQYNKYIGAGDTEEDEDEDVSKIVDRRMSLNQYNEVGMNFQKYQDIKPAAGVRREILNMFNEYKELEDKEHAKEELLAICTQYSIERYQFVGYFLSNALAEKPDDFRQYLNLVLDYFFEES